MRRKTTVLTVFVILQVCSASTRNSCENRCEEALRPRESSCYCDYACLQFGNCCNDYKTFCNAGAKYLCNGECNVTRNGCSCTENCMDDKSCCSDYQATCLNQTRWKDQACASSQEMSCPNGFNESPVILISLDGFKAEYIYRNFTPNIWKLASCGVHAPYMRSCYPTKTIPNHYSIATGLYPESHGIIDNRMYDHKLQEEFRLGSTAFEPVWWGGEPIWVTTRKQGKVSASFFWPGSDVNITTYPNYYRRFNESIPNQERIQQILAWLDLPPGKRPSLITLYMNNVDTEGHEFGPSSKINIDLAIVDNMVGMLMNGLKLRRLDSCVNIMVLADHGMSAVSCKKTANIADYGVDIDNLYGQFGPFGRVGGKSTNSSLWNLFDAEAIHNKLRCTKERSHWVSSLKYKYLPKRYHYANNDRIEPVLLTMDDGWLVEGKSGSLATCSGGNHGFDNEYRSMHALFTGHGPGFKRSYNATEPFENIEVYNLITDLLNLKPAPNNGTPGALYHIMSKPKAISVMPLIPVPNTCQYPPSNNAADLGCITCKGIVEASANQRLNLAASEVTKSLAYNMPFGRPQVSPVGLNDSVKYCVLTQRNYVVAYDHLKKLPFFVTYTLEDKDRKLKSMENCSRPDIRVPFNATTSCTEYFNSANIEAAYFYPPELSNENSTFDATVTTNQVPMYKPAKKIWNYMTTVLDTWSKSYGGINIMIGPAFDYNYDGLADTRAILQKNGKYLNDNKSSTPIPTHYFMILTRCLKGRSFAECKKSLIDLEFLTFVIPNYEVEPCNKVYQSLSEWVPGALIEHIARIRDVELLTGISFLSIWSHSDSVSDIERISAVHTKLRLPQFSNQWLMDFLSAWSQSGGKSFWSNTNHFATLLVALTSSLVFNW